MVLQSANTLSGESPNSKMPRYEFWFTGILMNFPLLPKKQMKKNKSSQNESIKQFDMFPWLMVTSWSFGWSRTRPNLDVKKMSQNSISKSFLLAIGEGFVEFHGFAMTSLMAIPCNDSFIIQIHKNWSINQCGQFQFLWEPTVFLGWWFQPPKQLVKLNHFPRYSQILKK